MPNRREKIKTFYDILEVAKSATPAELKHAYRKKARGHHPDKGGEATAMADINRAYACLKDPGRRLTYDQTGEDQADNPIENAIRDILLAGFNEILTKNIEQDCLGNIRRAIQQQLGQFEIQRSGVLKAKTNFTKRRDKIKTKNGDNLFQMLVDEHLGKIEGSLAQLDRLIKAHNGALEVLGNYESIEEVQQAISSQQFGFGTSSTGAW